MFTNNANDFCFMVNMLHGQAEPYVTTKVEVRNGQELEKVLTIYDGGIVSMQTERGVLYGKMVMSKRITTNRTTGEVVPWGKIRYSAWLDNGEKIVEMAELLHSQECEKDEFCKDGFVFYNNEAGERFRELITEFTERI